MIITADMLRRLAQMEPNSIPDALTVLADALSADEVRREKQRKRQSRHRNVTVTSPSRDNNVNVTSPSRDSHSDIPPLKKDIQTPPVKTVSNETVLSDRKPKKVSNKPKASPPDDGFEEFWEVVPRERRIAKRKAAAAYSSALKRAPPADIIAGMRRYAKACRETDPQFIAHPATWLNGDRWADAEVRTNGHASGRPEREQTAFDILVSGSADSCFAGPDHQVVDADSWTADSDAVRALDGRDRGNASEPVDSG